VRAVNYKLKPFDHRARARTTLFSWLFLCALVAACITLGIFQYRWISKVSQAAREHLTEGLRTSLMRIRGDFNAEISTAASSLAGFSRPRDAQRLESQLTARFAQWNNTSRRSRIFDRIALAVPGPGGVALQMLDLDRGVLVPAEWPADWSPIRNRIESAGGRTSYGTPAAGENQPPPSFRQPDSNEDGPRPGRGPGPPPGNEGLAFELPVIGMPEDDGGPGRRFGLREREIAWVIFNLNLPYVRETILPELLRRDLGSNGVLDYQVEVVARDNPDSVIFQSDPGLASIAGSADASAGLFEPRMNLSARRGEFGPPDDLGHGRGPRGEGRGPSPDMCRWQIYARHRAGSLDVVVAQARFRNMSVTGGVLLLMIATAIAFLRYTVRAQRLANMQMDFVAGVSHELRTPLTVIHTAGYNLQRIAHNPLQVDKYGAVIRRESARLRDLVEEVMRFARAGAGRPIDEREPLSVARVIEETVKASREAIDDPACVLESNVEADLPPVLGDPKALRHALENLVGNAAKYGAADVLWIGVYASKAQDDSAAIEIRVADRGPGIPEHEQRRIFDPFFRGARAIQDQIHGAGLGLSLVKKIIEAHGGSVRVESAPMRGAEFIVRIPAAPESA
jgi:signal transduction histidine kinase